MGRWGRRTHDIDQDVDYGAIDDGDDCCLFVDGLAARACIVSADGATSALHLRYP